MLLGETTSDQELVLAEMSGEGLQAPSVAVIDGHYKYIRCEGDPPLLYERSSDPHETNNLASTPAAADMESRLAGVVQSRWDLDALRRDVIESQRRRRLVDSAHAIGRSPTWDYDVPAAGSSKYFRPGAANPSASNYNDDFEIRARADGTRANQRRYP
jgi:choline-sulfatase